MLCQTKGCPYAPHIFGCPLFVWISPVCLDATICLDRPLYVWMPHMFGHPHMFGWAPVCLVPPMFRHPSKVRCPHMFEHPLYVWMPSMFGLPPCMFGCCQMYGGIQRYEGHLNIWGLSKHTGASKHVGHPNVWGAYGHPISLKKNMLPWCCVSTAGIQTSSKHTGASKHVGHPNVWGSYGHPISLKKHAFMVLYIYSRHPNIFQTYRGIQTCGASKYMGFIWTLHQSEKACFLGVVYVQQASKHLPNIHGGIQTYGSVHPYSGGIQT